jgi:hypothetical protein
MLREMGLGLVMGTDYIVVYDYSAPQLRHGK